MRDDTTPSGEVSVYDDPDAETIVDLQAQSDMHIAVVAYNCDAQVPLLVDSTGGVSVADLSIDWSTKYLDGDFYDVEHNEEALSTEEIEEKFDRFGENNE